MTATANGAKTAAKFRTLAASVAKAVADKLAPRETHTPKKAAQAMLTRIEAAHLERVKTALEHLADAHEAGTVPAALATIKAKAELATMLKTRIEHPTYYTYADTREFYDTTDRAVALRKFLDAAADPAVEAARREADRLRDLEEKVRFADIPGFFPTPPAVIERMLDESKAGTATLSYLEPSAGKGDIADAIVAAGPFTRVATFEVNYTLRELLKEKGHLSCGDDFLAARPPATEVEAFDRVLMNPPFENGADLEHVRHAYRFLKTGGRLVAVMSAGGFFRSDRKATEFRGWFDEVGGEKIDLPEGAFKDAFRATGTRVVLVVIDRP